MIERPPITGLTEVAGIEFCSTHGGVLVEGDDDECQYEELEHGVVPCLGVPMYHEGPAIAKCGWCSHKPLFIVRSPDIAPGIKPTLTLYEHKVCANHVLTALHSLMLVHKIDNAIIVEIT